jgi:hypothetical protein
VRSMVLTDTLLVVSLWAMPRVGMLRPYRACGLTICLTCSWVAPMAIVVIPFWAYGRSRGFWDVPMSHDIGLL